MTYLYNGYCIMWHDHNNEIRDWFVVDVNTGDCLHYCGDEPSCIEAIDNQNFSLVKRRVQND